MIKLLQLLQKLFTSFFVLVIFASLLTWAGIIDPFEQFEKSVRGDVESKLRIEAKAGDADAQNKLGTLLYAETKNKTATIPRPLAG
ncbi:MAG: hypothetical protein A6F71_08195 [Cycloclasticus sp. symbiont of Poecilosclerida sp. M]|nr:MAG: hypothetical protein A6F71_08195 [Cycloclasticus sp. symbiont of Poecilosclerida sp. M]